MEEELEDVTGYSFTQWDCPCGEVNHEEGDVTNQVVECESCGEKFRCERVQ